MISTDDLLLKVPIFLHFKLSMNQVCTLIVPSLLQVNGNILWKLKIPPKIRVFIWRAILNALPSLDNLVRRGIAQAALCPCCHLADESIMHLLFYCPYVEPIWFGSAVGLHPR
ncbi:hypothetical protein SLA2020_314180 [Shorea laevis]